MNKSQTPVNTATQDDEEKRKHRIRGKQIFLKILFSNPEL